MNFFTDAVELGIKVGDSLLNFDSTAYILHAHSFSVVGATTTDLSTGVLLATP